MEAVLDKTLAGVKGVRETTLDGARGALLETGRVELAPEDGAAVTLTIDANIQRFAQDAIARGGAEWQPDGIAAVVLRPSDGRILALASWPTYDAEAPPALKPAELAALDRAKRDGDPLPAALAERSAEVQTRLRNRAIMDTFEPGSILKPLIASYAIEKHAVSPTQVFDCSSPAKFGARTVRDVHNLGSAVPFPEVIAHSSNVGMSRIELALGGASTVELFQRCGFARRTGLGLPLEEAGITPSLKWWKPDWTGVSVAQGYELMVTPVQIASAFAALGNRGVRMRPQLVERVEDPRGRPLRAFQAEEAARIVDGEVAQGVMLPALMKVVEEGTGKKARMEKWTVGGKTGTAMKVVGRGYKVGHYRSSFVALAPIEKPEVLVCIMTDDPKAHGGVPYGGTVSAPIAKEILEKTLPYLKVPPSPPRAKPLDDGGPNHD
jgi:cell division protein FtsI/penicillin-binding protein 2